ncbi:MAG TPA: sugar transferase, partial [Flavobacterium sp.]|nr:sugar transferase [Flavobacterium sp.]
MRRTTGRYSGYIRPFSYLLDLIIINILTGVLLPETIGFYYNIFISITWITIALNIGFYEVYRYTKAIEIFGKILKQYALFLVFSFAYIGYFSKYSKPSETIEYTTTAMVLVAAFKFAVFYFLKRFRVVFGGNFRRVIIVGQSKNICQLQEFFTENPDYGYKLEKVFHFDKNEASENIASCFKFALDRNIDEIYCSLQDLSNSQVSKFVDFTDNNLKLLKFLPDNKEILSRNLVYDYYGYIPIISMRNIPLDKPFNKIVKRVFDIFFSLFIIIGLLSWLTPLLAILIKMESKGPIFFKQKRNGLNYKEFNCYKFRSMRPNEIADLEQVSKNDPRITKIGRFIRKTSIDELPQFFNVILGDMSVVGPRPHMVS